MNWNQVACNQCWALNNPGRQPVAASYLAIEGVTPPVEQCSWCGCDTRSGIFVRQHPDSVPFPQPDDD